MDYQEQYRRKRTDVDTALGLIRDGDTVIAGSVGTEPALCLSRLHTLAGRVHGVRYMSGLGMRSYPFMTDPAMGDSIRYDCIFLMDPGRQAHRAGRINVLPGHLHNGVNRWLSANGETANVFLVSVTPMDRHGYFRVPLCLIQERYLMENAQRIIVEVNPNLPTVYGETELHISRVDCIVESEEPLPVLESSKPFAVEQAIGNYVAELVEDGDCIQLGIGGIPDAAAQALAGRHDLGVHTEMITNSIVDLVEAGAVTGNRKNIHRGKIVGGFALGNQRLYDFLDCNPGVELRRGEYVNNPNIIAQNDHFVSINTAMAVDLGGQICSESIGSLHYSGSGGQADTAIGAAHSKGGHNVIALRSVKETKHGRVSGINAQLPAGSVVTLSRNDIDYIVTEYGIAPMRGRSVRERVGNLVAVAHPDFRAELRRDAERLLLW